MFNPRVFLINSTMLAVKPMAEAFEIHFPNASVLNIVDDSIPIGRVGQPRNNSALRNRLELMVDYACEANADGIILTCSLFAEEAMPAISSSKVPIVSVNQSLIKESLRFSHIVIVGTSSAPVEAITQAIRKAHFNSSATKLFPLVISNAATLLQKGDVTEAELFVIDKIEEIRRNQNIDVICFVQASISAIAEPIGQTLNVPIITPTVSSVCMLKELLEDKLNKIDY